MSSSVETGELEPCSRGRVRRVSRVSFGDTEKVEHSDCHADSVSMNSDPLVQETEATDGTDDDNDLSEVFAIADRRRSRRSVTLNLGVLGSSSVPAIQTSKIWQRRHSFSNDSASK
mmetsp:Transcript_65294/g.103465  ORF Transcript_65294/g.103465 Transcript_65294/m.103465 type:complete len:116 (-) Transcript_65294:375-722(-)